MLVANINMDVYKSSMKQVFSTSSSSSGILTMCKVASLADSQSSDIKHDTTVARTSSSSSGILTMWKSSYRS